MMSVSEAFSQAMSELPVKTRFGLIIALIGVCTSLVSGSFVLGMSLATDRAEVLSEVHQHTLEIRHMRQDMNRQFEATNKNFIARTDRLAEAIAELQRETTRNTEFRYRVEAEMGKKYTE
jgi:hypothetical protein